MKIILHIIKKEFQQFRRDPKMFGIILVAPILQLIFFGYAATLDVDIVHTMVFDRDNTEISRAFIREFSSSGFFKIDYVASRENEINEQIDKGNILVCISIPRDFEKLIKRHETSVVQLLFNGSDGNTANIAAGYASVIASTFSRDIASVVLAQQGRKTLPTGQIISEARVWYNPLMKTRYFMVPGIVAMLLSVITIILTSLAVVKEKEIGTLEQLIVTPIKSYQLILGKLIPFVMLGFVAVLLVLTGMRVIFGIAVRGNLSFLFFTSFLYILSTLGLGLFVSTISKTQQQAMMIAIFGALMPMVYLSGFTFPLENAPVAIQGISYFIPLRYFITIIRGVVLKGTGFAELWKETVMLGAMGATILLLASMRFRKKIE